MMDQNAVKECLDYNPETGLFRWRVRPQNHFPTINGWKIFNASRAGKTPGTIDSWGYLTIRIFGKNRLAHRLAWLYVHGKWPAHEIDHINHNPADNRISNLREATPQENQRNRSMQKNNKSGVTGVRWYKPTKSWLSAIRINRRTEHLGYFRSFFEAVCARKSAENKYDFHENHGIASRREQGQGC